MRKRSLRAVNEHSEPVFNEASPSAGTFRTEPSVNADLLKAKELDINLSATLEQALAAILKKKQREQWLAENAEAMNAYNEHVEAHGVFSDYLRSF
ncbi:type II toxin-antitoxin system CcdA family antitoxin [Stutzerimonas stutzeri]|uniref:type II toxin-antitoxin system CcdA family antitoxin n=1 Tax=Stutzerimonas stutzeri TaxID=316 RepID=UPI003014EF42